MRRRLGREALDRLVQPLVAGIYTADPNDLSLKATLPQFLAMEREHGSLILAGWRESRRRGGRGLERQASGARYGMFVTLADGMDTLPKALARALPEGTVRTGTAVRRISRNEPVSPWLVELLDGPPHRGRRGDRRHRSPRGGAISRLARSDPGPPASRDPVCIVTDRQYRLPARPDQPSPGRFRRGRAGHRGPADPGGVVP